MATRETRLRHRVAWQPELQKRARWTAGLVKIFADLMVDQVHNGNKVNNNSFNKKAWKIMCDQFYQRTGLKWDKEQLKSRFLMMRKQHAIVKSLLSRSEFRLDESTGNIIASNKAWNQFFKGNPDAEPAKSSGCPIYKQLGVIFSEPLTNGKHVCSVEQEQELSSSVTIKNPRYSFAEQELPTSVLFKEPMTAIREESCSESEDGDDVTDEQETFQPLHPTHVMQPVMHNTTRAVDKTVSANRKRGRRGTDDAIAEAILSMAAASKLKTTAITKLSERFTVADCIKELGAMQGVEAGIYFAALDLFDNRNAREIFLSLKGDKRLTWLRGKCTAHQKS